VHRWLIWAAALDDASKAIGLQHSNVKERYEAIRESRAMVDSRKALAYANVSYG
jgi:hypothetical protein